MRKNYEIITKEFAPKPLTTKVGGYVFEENIVLKDLSRYT